jgi:CRP-like cAMP-binding protein
MGRELRQFPRAISDGQFPMDGAAEEDEYFPMQEGMHAGIQHKVQPRGDPRAFKNKLLQNLAPESIDRLRLRALPLEMGREMEYPGRPIDHLFFLEEGIASMTTAFVDGSQVEVGMFGFESVIGISALMGTKQSLNRIYMQMDGSGFSSPTDAARKEFQLHAHFHHLALRYVQAQLTQATQSAGCNAKHELDQRLARWLLQCSDRAHSDTLVLSQEFIANMLGSARPTVSIAAGVLKGRGLIDYHRGTIHILDRPGLEERSCECYRVVKNHLDNYTEFDTGFEV